MRYNDFDSWTKLKEVSESRFVQRWSQSVVATELVNFNQSKNSDILAYATTIQNLPFETRGKI